MNQINMLLVVDRSSVIINGWSGSQNSAAVSRLCANKILEQGDAVIGVIIGLRDNEAVGRACGANCLTYKWQRRISLCECVGRVVLWWRKVECSVSPVGDEAAGWE
jgi:hypothetical protein